MAYSEQPDRSVRRRPFATWVKKLTNFKGSSDGRQSGPSKLRMHGKRRAGKKNNPYPQSGYAGGRSPAQPCDNSSISTTRSGSETSLERQPTRLSIEGDPPPTAGARSVSLTVSTDHEASRSVNAPDGASSVTGTAQGAGQDRQGGSTFSSPAPSVRSLTTTLTTIQSLANGNASANAQQVHHGSHHSSANNSHTITFNQPFPTTSPASALPPHLAPHSQASPHPTTYSSATANNLLTDNASILTLASSSKRRRRRSFDTDASVRALAPSSLWGGSRESLPLSVLSANVDGAVGPHTPSLQRERTSMYSAAGATTASGPALQSERNSFYARQSVAGDGASARSGLLGHGRAESISGSAGMASPLASPMEVHGVDELEEGRPVAGKDEKGKGKAVEKE